MLDLKTSGNSVRIDKTVRQCAVSRERLPKSELIRFVLDPDGQVVPDLKNRLPGRGVWVSAQAQMVTEAVKRKVFSRGFKTAAGNCDGLAERLDTLLNRSCLESLSLANKAGQVLTGYGKISSGLEAGKIVCLIHAVEAAKDGSLKLDRKLTAIKGPRALCEKPVGIFNCDELSLALGGTNVIHVGLRRGGAVAKLLISVQRLMRYRSEQTGNIGQQG